MKMKKLILMLLILVTVISGCADKNENGNQNVLSNTEGIDIDLTLLSSIMVYSEVYNMVYTPDDYIGKTIKVSGTYSASYYDETDMYYHFVIVDDATECCQSGLEFVWNGNHVYPSDYPNEGDTIEIIGVYGSYDELGYTYFYLSVDDINIA